MELKNNKTLLVFLSWCIILFNPAQAICVHRNQSNPELSSPTPTQSSSATHSSQPPPSPPTQQSSTQTSQQPPSPPQPTSVPAAPVPPTPTSEPQDSPDAPSPKPELPKLQISLPTGPLSVGVGAGGIGVGVGVKPITDPIVKGLCDKTDLPPLCLSSIAPFFNGKTDVTSVIEMLIKSATEQTKQAITTARTMANGAKSDPKKLSMFNDCFEIYDDALDNLQEAVDAIPAKDIGTLETMVSAAISDYSTCDDGFTGQPNPIPDGVSPMAKVNDHLMNIASVILALAKLIP